MTKRGRKLVILNQAANYLTIGFANAFRARFDEVVLITGSVHTQGEELRPDVKVHPINRWYERPAKKKAWSYLRALWNMWWLLMTRYRNHEVFFVSVPPMGYLLNIILPHRFSMVIWDVFPDALKIAGLSDKHPVYRIWSRLNKRSFRKAHRLFTISEKMAELLAQYVPADRILIQPIWSIFQENAKVPPHSNPFVKEHRLQDLFVVQYSGNIGLSHNVEVLIDIAEKLQDYHKILFQIIGRGPRKPVLERMVAEKNLPNCQFLPFQSDDMFPYSLSAASLGVVILDDVTSKGSVPSKSYNLMSYGIPSLYMAARDSQLNIYAERFGHAVCYPASDLDKAAAFIISLSEEPRMQQKMGEQAEEASRHFRRDNADRFVDKYFQDSKAKTQLH